MLKKTTSNSSKKRLFLISLILLLHSLGVLVVFFQSDIPFHYHLLRCSSWWSVHTSILTIWVAISNLKRKKKTDSYLTQLITFLATFCNLTTLLFWSCGLLFFGGSLNIHSVLWHVAAPLGTLIYFYFYAQISQLKQKLFKTLLLVIIYPVFYGFYVLTLAKLNVGESSSLFPYIKKYPYPMFSWLADREWKWFIVNFLITCLVFLSIAGLIIWTKLTFDKKLKKDILQKF